MTAHVLLIFKGVGEKRETISLFATILINSVIQEHEC